MKPSNFYNIITSQGLEIAIEGTSHFTLGTSPYYSHQNGLAVDIYQQFSLESYEVLSPISGEVEKTKEMRAPKPKFLNGTDKEYLIIISNLNNSKSVFKTLHVKPRVKVGDKIQIGDVLGTTIRNGYFSYWSSPHIHVEIRPSHDAIRARGGEEFILHTIKDKNKKPFEEIVKSKQKTQIPVEICEIYPEFFLVHFPKELYHYINPFFGVMGNVNGSKCILDGGIPLYKNGIVIFEEYYETNSNDLVYLEDKTLGSLTGNRNNLGFFKFKPIRFYLNKRHIMGLSFFLARDFPFIKIIPQEKDQFSFNKNTTQYLIIESI